MFHFGVTGRRTGVLFHTSRYLSFMLAFGAFFILGGGGVDFARAAYAEARLEDAAGAVADALTPRSDRLSDRDVQISAETMLAPALAAFDDPLTTISTRKAGPSVRVYVNVGMPTTFLRLFLRERLTMEAVSTGAAPRPSRNLAWWI